jgi:Predicted membrane protein (DUF2079)
MTAVSAAGAHAAPSTRQCKADTLPMRMRRIGYVVLGLQLAVSLFWSALIYDRFAVTFDFSMFQQAWTLIAHGNLDPINTVKGIPFWQDHSELFLWPIALLYWIWPHGVVLLWLQDIAVVGAEAIAFTWLCEVVKQRRLGADGEWLAAVGLILLVANPWTWWALSWDFHSETTAMPFAVLLAWDLSNNRRRAWAWLVPLLASGDVAATYIAAIGAGAALAGRPWRMRGIALAGLGIGATVLITLVHGNLGSGSGLQAYSYLASPGHAGHLGLGAMARGIIIHPLGVLEQLWSKRSDIWANTAPSGLPGLGYLWLLPMALNVVAANNLFHGLLFAAPGFQSLPLYILLPVGTVAVLAKLTGRHRWVALLLTGLVAAEAMGYAAVWLPQTPSQWLRVSAPTAATLARVEAQIPSSAEVLASQGVMGRFAGRIDIQALFGPGPLPLQGGQTWFVITPNAGIETMQPAASMELIAELAGPLNATLVTHANGVWAFRWFPPPNVHRIIVPNGLGPVRAWTHPGVAGLPVMTGPVPEWHLTSTGKPGYVSDGLEWRDRPGYYQASVSMSASGQVNLEVWNDNCDTLLARRTLPPSRSVETITLPVDATTACTASAFAGWGPFRADFIQPPPGQTLEIRVWSPGSETVEVYRASLVPTSSQPKS